MSGGQMIRIGITLVGVAIIVFTIVFPNANPFRKKRMFPEFSTLKYKAFRFWKRWQYAKYFLFEKENFDYDWASIINFLVLKLTMMGLHFAKWGVIVDTERKKQVRSIWQTRKYLKNVQDAFDIQYEKAQKKYTAKYGFPYESKLRSEPIENSELSTIHFDLVVPYNATEVEKLEMEKYWHKIFTFNSDYEFEKENLKKALDNIYENLHSWWD